MKKIIIVLLFFIAATAWSQNSKTPEDLSIVAGPGLSHVFGSDKLDPAFGLLVGIEKNVVQLGEKSFFNSGISFSIQNVGYHDVYNDEPHSESDVAVSGKVRLTYIGLPFVYRHQSPGGFFWEAGIQPGFLLGAKDLPDDGEKSDYKDFVKAIDIGIPAGIGYWFNQRYSIGARVVYGLTDMSGNGAKIPPSDGDHQNLLVTAMFRFNLTGK
jgi:Outer membrane protein beta-barrel domain